MIKKTADRYPPEEFKAAIARLVDLQAKHYLFISDGTSGADKVSEALFSHRTLLPVLESVLRCWSGQLMDLVGMYPEDGRWGLADEMLALAKAVNDLPPSQSPDRLRAALERIAARA